MVLYCNELPDFKTKLLYLQRSKPKLVPGFGEAVKDNMPCVRIPIPDLQEWFEIRSEELEETDQISDYNKWTAPQRVPNRPKKSYPVAKFDIDLQEIEKIEKGLRLEKI